MARRPFPERIFRALLRLFPGEFRGDFADQMTADFRDQHREAAAAPRRLVPLWVRTAVDIARQAPREHLDILRRDAVHALRVLRQHPGATATAVLSLAIGIGANSAIFSVVSGVLWRELPYDAGDRLVQIGTVSPTPTLPPWQTGMTTAGAFLDLQQRARTIDSVAGATFRTLTFVEPGEPEEVSTAGITRSFFAVLGAKPVLGRTFTPAEHTPVPGATQWFSPPRVMLLSYDLWQRRFSGDPNVIGRRVRLAEGSQPEIVGVMGPELKRLAGTPFGFDAWVPQELNPAVWGPPLWTYGRLAGGASIDQVQAELDVLGRSTPPPPGPASPQAAARFRAVPLIEAVTGRVRTQLTFLLGAVVCVLLITCANITILFVAQASGRHDELATRTALGATRAHLVRQMVTESLLVAGAGGVAGLMIAWWGVPALVALTPADVPRLKDVGVDWWTFGFAAALSCGSGVACGIIGSFPTRALRPAPSASGTRATAAPRTVLLRRGLTVIEIALALMLVVAASLMVRTVLALNAIDLGFDPANVISVALAFRLDGDDGFTRVKQMDSAVIEQVQSLPGVRAAGIGLGPLLGGMFMGGVTVPGNPRTFDARVDPVSPGYFEALGAHLLEGRLFDRRDLGGDAPSRIVINTAAAHAFWPGENPLGKTVLFNGNDALEVIGVIANLRAATLEEEPGPAIYQLSHQSRNFHAGTMLIRVDGDPAPLVPAIRSIIRRAGKDTPFREVAPLRDRIDRAMAPRVFILRVIGFFSVIGVLLAVIGVYGVIAASVAQRVAEIATRMALGATTANILALVLTNGLWLIAGGIVLGVAGAGLFNEAMATMVYGVRTSDPSTYAIAGAAVFATTVAACALPAYRASQLNPSAALRSE